VRAPYTGARPLERDDSTQAAEAYVGYAVRDPRGRRLGRTMRVFVNGRGEPEYIEVKMGFLGFKTVLLPVQSVAADEKRRALSLQ
jgi:hypothetical protein